MAQPLFGIVPAGLSVLTTPAQTPSPTSFLYAIPPTPAGAKPFSHVVVFLLPGIQLPPGTAAAIYLVTPPDATTTTGAPAAEPCFLGGIGPGKESAIFKLGGSASSSPQGTILGISIEDAISVAARIDEKAAASSASSSALVQASSTQPSTLVLAQRIIQNAFNFLASYGTGTGGGVEVVPLQAFEAWWRKFESRVRSDPTFLEHATE